jgi:hypothetical protein
MQYVGWALWALGAIWALGASCDIRRMVRDGDDPPGTPVDMVMLWVVGLLVLLFTGWSPFHLLWYWPAALIVGQFPRTSPFSPLSIPGQLFGRLCCLGVDRGLVSQQAEARRVAHRFPGPKDAGVPAR